MLVCKKGRWSVWISKADGNRLLSNVLGNRPAPPLPSNADICGQAACLITGKLSLDHPTWGPTWLVFALALSPTSDPAFPTGTAVLVAIDTSSTIRWRHVLGENYEQVGFNAPSRDLTGHLFLNWNPGRYNGVTILQAVPGGFSDFSTLPSTDDYDKRFYSAEVADVNQDGTFEVIRSVNDCVPTCAEGTVTKTTYRWNGADYVAG